MSISLLSKLEKITATRDFVAIEHSLLRAIGATVHVEDLSLWTLDVHQEVSKVLHYSRQIEVRGGSMGRDTEEVDTVYANIEVPPDVRSLAQTVVLSLKPAARRTQNGSLQMFPLMGSQGLSGLISMRLSQPMVEQDQELINGILRVYSNYHALLDESQRDRLTGLYNRHAMDLNIDRMWSVLGRESKHADARRSSVVQMYALAVIDIDHFKKVNDEFGHILGDEILLLVSRLISSCFRKSDPVYRYGGEEFLVVTGADSAQAMHTLFERVRAKVAAHYFPQVENVTVSLGYTIIDPALSPSENIGRADRALYVAKDMGRNQVQSYSDLIERGLIKDMRYGSTELF
ncbi:GGDEF domain-containing protein [Rhodoferax aquaticus]|uniref:diguanylate cyclase n=1 Tax=Rhodoferax aquaticus TaxID=2527691 RepID=A0A515EKJ7_9BURK|nr:GGDEF domain-containing protein [Rhodoferax aquaticus]QDL53193.1 GGDEF domain-containing protein [Rhodoferax aquaticus]